MSTPISFRRACSLALTVFALAACSEALAPPPILDVAVHVSDQQGPFASGDSTSPGSLVCDVTFEALGAGHHARATWLDASILFYSGANRNPYDSLVVSAKDIRTTFSADTIGVGQIEHTRWFFFVPVPIGIGMNFRYQVDPGGDIKTATAQLACGNQGQVLTSRRPAAMPAAMSPYRVVRRIVARAKSRDPGQWTWESTVVIRPTSVDNPL